MRERWIGVLVVAAGLACGGSNGKPAVDGGGAGAGGGGAGGGGAGSGGAGGGAPDAGPGPDGGGQGGQQGGAMFAPMGGSRLKIRWLDGPDGQRSFEGFYDTQLKVPCFFLKASDGELRCLPLAHLLDAALSDWADSACSTPVVPNVRANCQDSPFVRRRDVSNPCEVRERVYRLAEKIAENRTWRKTADGTCVASAVFASDAAYRVGEELPASMFAKGTLTPEPAVAGTPVQLVTLVSEDGARVDFGWRNSAANADCSLSFLSDGKLHCVPTAAASLSTVANTDPACSQPAAFFQVACGPQPTVVRQPSRGMCPATSTVHALGPKLEMVYRRNGAMCEAAPPAAGNQYHAIGDAIPDATFPTFEQVNDMGSQRVRRRRLVAPGGRSIGGAWWDSERQDICVRGLTAGKQRCVPLSTPMGFHFADAGCTQWLLQIPRESCAPKTAFRRDNSTCPAGEIYYSVGAAHTGMVWELQNVRSETSASLECRPVAPSATEAYHTVTLIPGGTLPEMTLTEPPPT